MSLWKETFLIFKIKRQSQDQFKKENDQLPNNSSDSRTMVEA